MKSLPLFHRIAGTPVIVLGGGQAAEAKRRLVERAGGEVVDTIEEGWQRGARLAFVALEGDGNEEAAKRLKLRGVLVNVVDRPELCDFTTPSIIDRDPVLVAIGTGGVSAGLAKQVRLRLDALLPASLGALAEALNAAREKLRARWPDAGERRRALDAALSAGGALDPLREDSAGAVESWLSGAATEPSHGLEVIELASASPDDLTLRQARLLGAADVLLVGQGIPQAILDRARADALRRPAPHDGPLPPGLVVELRRR
jgi:uroporphyrin-III C-methyltransferase/precorrin-2 dehydrogenase/sirohydrochlorin ferrochelatase